MRVERLVLDTNVVISAVLSPLGKPYACLRWALDNATLMVSRELLEELETRLARPKFDRYLDASKRRAVVADLALSAVQVELRGAVKICRDPDDDKLLEIAVVGRADCLVTGDQDLLMLDPFQGIPSAACGLPSSSGDRAKGERRLSDN
jgi:putative PIN family toxin of toxin-antitoxin system